MDGSHAIVVYGIIKLVKIKKEMYSKVRLLDTNLSLLSLSLSVPTFLYERRVILKKNIFPNHYGNTVTVSTLISYFVKVLSDKGDKNAIIFIYT